MTDDIRKLLGGYATGTLTAEEREALYAAALEDQSLFEALADEHALKELLEDSTARAHLLQATETPHFSVSGVLREWLERPKSKALVALGAVLFLSIAVKELAWDRYEPPAEESKVAMAPSASREERSAEIPEAPRSIAKPPVRRKLAQEAPRPAAVVADAAPDTTTKIAKAGDIEMKYTVLLRNSEGVFLPVAADHAFTATDRVRLRVEVNRSGMVTMTGHDGRRVYVASVVAGAPITVPDEVEFVQAAEHSIELAFAEMPESAASPAMSYSSAREERANGLRPRAAAPAAGVVGGAPAIVASPPPPALAVRLNLRRKP